MEVGQLRYGVADFFVDRTGDFAPLDMCDRDVHVRPGNRGSHRFKTICNGDNNIGSQIQKRG